MSDIQNQDQEPESQTSDDTKGTENSFLEGTYKGQKVSWSEEEARNLAQKGFDYETKKAALKAEKEALASDQEDFDRFKAWRESLQADPRRAEAVAKAWQDPDSVLVAHQQVDDDGEPVHRPAPAPAKDPEVFQLKSQIEQLQGKLNEMSSLTEEKASEERLGRAVDSNSFLSSNSNVHETAVEIAKGLMAQDPEMSPEGAIAVAAQKLKGVVQQSNQDKLNRKGKAEDMRTVPANEGSPVGASEGTGKKKETPYGQRRVSTLLGDVKRQLADGVFKDRFPNAGY